MRQTYQITEQCSGQSFECAADQSTLKAMEQQGLKYVLVGCRGGGRREITAAGYRTNVHDHGKDGVPDMLGFRYTERPEDNTYNRERWVAHAIGVMDALDLQQVDLVGNSFGGGLALTLAIEQPERVRRLVLMGSVGVSFPITQGTQIEHASRFARLVNDFLIEADQAAAGEK